MKGIGDSPIDILFCIARGQKSMIQMEALLFSFLNSQKDLHNRCILKYHYEYTMLNIQYIDRVVHF